MKNIKNRTKRDIKNNKKLYIPLENIKRIR